MPPEPAALRTSGTPQPAPDMFESTVKTLRESLTCQICLKLLYQPFTTSCGHTYCYECLNQWFKGNGDRLKKTCPDCRSRIKQQPAPAYLMRQMVEVVCRQKETLPEGETMEEHVRMRQEMDSLVDKHRAATGRKGGLFEGCFNYPDRPNATRDAEDGNIWRCPHCFHELEEHYCHDCDLNFDSDGAPVHTDAFYDDYYSDGLDEDDLDMHADQLVNMQSLAPPRGPHRSPWRVHTLIPPALHRHRFDFSRYGQVSGTDDDLDSTDSSHGESDEEEEDDVSDLIDDDGPNVESNSSDGGDEGEETEEGRTETDSVRQSNWTPMPELQRPPNARGLPQSSTSSRTMNGFYEGPSMLPESPHARFSSPESDVDASPRTVEHNYPDGDDNFGFGNSHQFEDEFENEEAYLAEFGAGGYNDAGTGPLSSDEDETEDSKSSSDDDDDDDDEDEEPIRRAGMGSRKRPHLVLSDSEDDYGPSSHPARRRRIDDHPTHTTGRSIVREAVAAGNRNRSRNGRGHSTTASQAPLRSLTEAEEFSSDEEDGSEEDEEEESEEDEDPVFPQQSRRRTHGSYWPQVVRSQIAHQRALPAYSTNRLIPHQPWA